MRCSWVHVSQVKAHWSRTCDSLDVTEPYGPLRSVTPTTLLPTFEALTAVVIKRSGFFHMVRVSPLKINKRFCRKRRRYHQGRRKAKQETSVKLVLHASSHWLLACCTLELFRLKLMFLLKVKKSKTFRLTGRGGL
jgi:hypothetical protein